MSHTLGSVESVCSRFRIGAVTLFFLMGGFMSQEIQCVDCDSTCNNSHTSVLMIQEEIKGGLKSRNACYHLVQNLLSSSLISKSFKVEVYRSIILPVVLYGCETWSLTLMEE
jgi:hypothetical protein